MRYVIGLSGGMDSTTLLYHLRAQGHDVVALTVKYGQRHVCEVLAAEQTCRALGVQHQVVDLSGLRALMAGSALTDNLEVPEGHYAADNMKATVVPNRNMVLLSVALSWCVSLDFDGIAYAAHAGDHAVYPDCRPEFAGAMAQAASLCDYKPRMILRPFVDLSKAQIAKLGHQYGVDWGLTWSCYQGKGTKHCGRCGTCVERIEAFRDAGVPDPTQYEVDPEAVYANMPRS